MNHIKQLLILLLFTLTLSATSYQDSWIEVEGFDKQRLPKSALKKVETIFQQAKAEKNENQYIKALLYKEKYQAQLSDNDMVTVITELEKELNQTPTPQSKYILTSLLAQMYATYLDQNQYKIKNRTDVKNNQSSDIQTWSIKQLTEKASQLYLDSLNTLTQEIPINNYSYILSKSQNVEGLRPTLYDFLAHRALNYFNNKRNFLHQPSYAFTLQSVDAYAPINTFVNHHFETKNKSSFDYQSLLIYQELLKFHQCKKETKALEHLNLERLLFVQQKLHDDSSYIKALKEQQSPETLYYLAQFYLQHGDYIQAIKYAKNGIESNDIYTQNLCYNIKNQIETKSLKLEIETVNLPHENILAKINYRNSSQLFIKVIKLTEQQKEKLKQTKQKEKLDYLNSLPNIKGMSLTLPKTSDYKSHSTEISLGAYPLGQYIFFLSTEKDFTQHNIYQIANISNIAYLQQGGTKLLTLHRKTGKPLSDVTVSFFTEKYNQYLRQYEQKLYTTKKSDKKGFVSLKGLKGSFKLKFSHDKDILDLQNHHSLYLNGNPYGDDRRSSSEQVHFFMDRSIYRPSQTIYFKGLAIKVFGQKAPKILTNKKVEVTFYNTNKQKIESKTFTTDEFGTFNGTFTAPKSGLLGSMYIRSSHGDKSFRVEEYKRPKFEVSFNPLNKSYHLGETISMTGVAKAYAGNFLDGATVKYRVERSSYFPWRCYWNPIPYTPTKLLTRGTTKSDKKGEFKIDFTALADEHIKNSHPNYRYTLHVDVTDTTGETHSNSKTIQLGEVDLNVVMDVKPQLNLEENATLTIKSSNLNGEFKAINGSIVVEKLEKEKKIYRKRYWGQVEKAFYTKEAFEKAFSHYRFGKEEKRKKEVITQLPFNTGNQKTVSLNGLKQGEYILTLKTNDENGKELTLSTKVTLYNPKATEAPIHTYLWQKTDKASYEVGEEATLTLQSSVQNIPILFTLEKNGKIINEKWLTIEGMKREIIKIKEESKGDLSYQLNFVKENRPFSQSGTIHVPWDNKLKIEYLTFRDKLKPNQEEQWKIKISGKNSGSIMAQMVATMYDASLDTFGQHNLSLPNFFPKDYASYNLQWQNRTFNQLYTQQHWINPNREIVQRVFPHIKWFNHQNSNRYRYRQDMVLEESVVPIPMPVVASAPMARMTGSKRIDEEERGIDAYASNSTIVEDKSSSTPPLSIRKNLNETMFFKPNLQTDAEGNIIIDFKTNGALTRWNFMGFVHTKDLKTAVTQKSITTQKELMVVTNLPRFFREKDKITLSAKVVNMSDKDLTGECELQLVNPENEQPIYGQALKKPFIVAKGESTTISFHIQVPDVDKIPAIKHTFIARTNTHSDAEQVIKPILSNRVFITESKVLSLKANESKSFTLNSLKENNSSTLKNHKLTLEFTSNPAWYAIQSLPYLMEYQHECSEQLFSRYYANALASKVANSSPKIKAVFDSWRAKGQLKSKLSLNEELKSVLREETPWVLEAQSQEVQQRNIALLFDLHRVASEQKEALEKLKERQLPDGGFSWFGGDKSNWYITQYLVEGMGHLKNLGVEVKENSILKPAIGYLDTQLNHEYKELVKRVEENLTTFKADNLSSMITHYLYARSFFDQKMSAETQKAYHYYLGQAKKYWGNKALYEEGMLALALHRVGEDAQPIVASLKERALVNDELGMYFKYNAGYYWNQLPIETHTLMIEVFDTVAQDKKSVELLKIWLLKQRQTSHWKTTKATSSAIYALLSNNDWLNNSALVDVSFETTQPYQKKLTKAKANAIEGLGYFKATFDKFDQSMATVKVTNPNNSIAWGGLYWQYFEDMDKVKTFKETPLTIDKKLYKVVSGDNGEQLTELDENSPLTVGDKVKVRIEIRVDRAMEYVMLKDSRASTFEPLNVLSRYKYQDGLGYYESTKDNATYFFMSYLPKGTYVFEYPLVVSHKGDFSNGITTMESMYAPEFKSHSEGVRVRVE